MNAAKPFLKWAGGKTKLLPRLKALLPPDIRERRHIEPFVGGGAMFFSQTPQLALLSDVNADLVIAYLTVRENIEELLALLTLLATAYARNPEVHYYAVRDSYNAKETGLSSSAVGVQIHSRSHMHVFRTAQFIYLNKTCFNGLHRVNKSGEFNVPIGDYKEPLICDENTLRAAHAALGNVEVYCQPFENMLRYAEPNDFVYFDPPYEPVSDSSSFTSYAKDGFGRADHVRLREVVDELDRRGCKVMLSNSDTPFLRALYSRYTLTLIDAARSINSKGDGRGAVSELVVTNYAKAV